MDGYVDTIDKVLEYLESEKSRRLRAVDSNEFCDNKTGKRHIRILDTGIKAMKLQMQLENTKGVGIRVCNHCEHWNSFAWICKNKGTTMPNNTCKEYLIRRN